MKIKKTNAAKQKFAIWKLKRRFKKRIDRRGGLEGKHENYMRYTFGLLRHWRHLEAERVCKEKAFVPFLKEWFYREDMKAKFYRARRLFLFIKSRFTAQIQMRKSKLVVLTMHWEQQLGRLTGKAGGKDRKQLATVLTMPPALRDELLSRYLTQCRLRHSIAFFQWRDQFIPTASKDELLEVFDSKINFIRRSATRLCAQHGGCSGSPKKPPADPGSTPQPRQRGNSGTANSASKRNEQKGKKANKFLPHFINHFEELGWVDPLPDDTAKAAEAASIAKVAFEHSCYHEAKMIPAYPPLTIYLPSPALTKKIIGVVSRTLAKNQKLEPPMPTTIEEIMSNFH